MASKKQRRRREKERRHEYEYVYVDSDGREIPVDEVEPEQKPEQKNGKAAPQAQRAIKTERGRNIEPPSWRRVFRRGMIFAPLMAIIVYLLQGKDKSVAGALVQTLVLMTLFLPFSYLMDSLMYRSARKRLGAKGGGNATQR